MGGGGRGLGVGKKGEIDIVRGRERERENGREGGREGEREGRRERDRCTNVLLMCC